MRSPGNSTGKKCIALISLYGTENAGIRILAALLRKKGYRSPLILFKRWVNNRVEPPSKKEKDLLISVIKREGATLAGISFGASAFVKIAREIVGYIKENLDIPVITGGIHATLAPEECIRFSDAVCVGEGEIPLLQWVEASTSNFNAPIDGLWTKDVDGRIFEGKLHIYEGDMDALPPPLIIEPPIYYIDKGNIFYKDPLIGKTVYKVYSSRGCPYRCSYCFNSVFHRLLGRKGYYRIRSVDSVISELVHVKERLKHIRLIRFDDDVFVIKEDWLDRFVEVYPEKVGIPFECLLNPAEIDAKLILKLKKAGLERVEIGIQGGTRSMVEGVYERRYLNEKVRMLAPLFKKNHISVNYDVIVDNPLSEDKDREELLRFLKSLPKPYQLTQFSLTFFPCTDLTERLLREGRLSSDDIEGANDKTLRQFLVTLDYPRNQEEIYYICMNSLASKWFIPSLLLNLLERMDSSKKNPSLLIKITKSANFMNLLIRGFKHLIKRRLSADEIEEYGGIKNLILN